MATAMNAEFYPTEIHFSANEKGICKEVSITVGAGSNVSLRILWSAHYSRNAEDYTRRSNVLEGVERATQGSTHYFDICLRERPMHNSYGIVLISAEGSIFAAGIWTEVEGIIGENRGAEKYYSQGMLVLIGLLQSTLMEGYVTAILALLWVKRYRAY